MGAKTISEKTVRLGRGRHRSSTDGACVIEIASMLAAEEFSDSPQSVCPVIARLLRRYNDRIGKRRQDDLYGVASQVVGTRADRRVELARARRCREAVTELGGSLNLRVWLTPRSSAPLLAAHFAGSGHSGKHERLLRLIEELVAIGGSSAAVEPVRAASEPAALPPQRPPCGPPPRWRDGFSPERIASLMRAPDFAAH